MFLNMEIRLKISKHLHFSILHFSRSRVSRSSFGCVCVDAKCPVLPIFGRTIFKNKRTMSMDNKSMELTLPLRFNQIQRIFQTEFTIFSFALLGKILTNFFLYFVLKLKYNFIVHHLL